MKKIIFISFILILLTGCSVGSDNNILKKLNSNLDKSKSYYLEGDMEIINNEDVYTYQVKVSYQKDNYYKVELTNKSNNHEQVILRNKDGVYVVTPNLNKSFKFQSDWPNNNSQVYLLESIMKDINNDKDYIVKHNDSGYVITSSVNYPNNTSLVKQNVYVDNNANVTKVEVLDSDLKAQIKMEFSKVELNHKFDDNYFDLNQVITVKENTNNEKEEENTKNAESENATEDKKDDDTTNDANLDNEEKESKKTVTIDDIVYPMYLPDNTYLTSKESIDTDNGKRLILNFDGDSSFVLIEESSVYDKEGLLLPVSGNIDFVTDVLAVVSDNSITWSNGGIDYYMASDNLESSELLQIARSISSLPVSK